MEGLSDYADNAVMQEGQKARYAGDKRMLVRFYTKPVQNKFKSNEEGRPIFDKRDYIRIMIPGDRNSIYEQPVKQEHKIRFEEQYKRFKANEQQAESGTPLEVWPQMTVDRVAELKFMGVETVEQLAEMDDVHGQKIMGFHDMKRRAVAFLDIAKTDAENSKLATALEKRDVEIAALKEQINQIIKDSAPKKSTRGRAKTE